MPELPTGTVTFLFTDLEDSTRLWEEHPEAMKDALARHDEILRDAVESRAGCIVKTTGDGVHAAFTTAQGAVDAAVAAQRAFVEQRWEPEPFAVRMGVHTGEADVRDGDYYGPALNRAARLMSLAQGAQTLVSHATEELVRDAVTDGVALRDLGEQRLRDLSRAERVFQVEAPGLRSDFPPLRSLDAFPGNLPMKVTSFVGRDRELIQLGKLLETSRLITLTGVGGVGKTRLATQLAADVLPRFPDGAWVCELAAASDPDALVQVVAATLGVQQRPNVTLEESILEFLRTKQTLIVLDNCEHLLDEAGRLAEGILHDCPRVGIVGTSREGLAVDGEQVWPVRSLQTPSTTSVDDIATSAAVRLFAERAQAVVPAFAVDASNASAVAEICRRLDGIPLAIELAAARVTSMSPTEIAALLDERFRLLTGGRRTAVERHQTLRATVDWSYSLLEPSERLVFDRLGVFAGSFDSAAASAVVAEEGIEQWDVVEAMASLVGKSMVNTEKTPEDTTRYSMLETLRQYARERLDESREADAWRRRHAEHYAAFAEAIARELIGPGELAARRRVGLELDNLRAAVTWALDSGSTSDVEIGVGIIAHLAFEASANVASGIGAWAERAVPCVGASSSARRHALLGGAAYYAHQGRGDLETGRALAIQGVAEGLTELSGTVHTLTETTLAMSYMATGEQTRLRAVVAAAHRGLDAIGDNAYARSTLHSAFASMLLTVGDVDGAKQEADAGMKIARSLSNPTCLTLAHFAFGWAWSHDDPEAALAAFDESIALTRAGAVDGAYGAALCQAALLRAHKGDERGALEGLREAIAYSDEVGDRVNFSNAVNRGTEIVGRLGHAEVSAVFGGIVSGQFLGTSLIYELKGSELVEHEAVRDRVRAELGEDDYAAATARGAAMSYDDIVGFTLGELDGILAELGDG
jgi:predicted ATPase/class 3 adenylate cyclase